MAKSKGQEIEVPVEVSRDDIARALRKGIATIVTAIREGDCTSARLSALVKLIEIEKEFSATMPKHVTVQWVETWESNHSNGE